MARTSYLIYDGDCPFCSAYVLRFIKFRERFGHLEILNAREPHEIVDEVKRRHDLDSGFVFIFDGVSYYNADAIQALNTLSDPDGLFYKGIAMLFRRRWFARFVYPILVMLRRLFFTLTGRKFIHD